MKIKALTDVGAVLLYLQRVGAEARSLRTAVVKEHRGNYWKDLAVIRFTKTGDVVCPVLEYAPTEEERNTIKVELSKVQWPELKPLRTLGALPEGVQKAKTGDRFIFRNEAGEIIMIQVRVTRKGEKAYVPYTYWDDDEWRCAEPDGALPLFNLEKLKDAAYVFIHEGAKSARYVQWMVDGETEEARKALAAHPWGKELSAGVHLGWIGGALSPQRTDWSPIRRTGARKAFIVADNDKPGRAAVPAISREIGITAFMIQFTDEFPASFDLADDFPKAMFGKADGGHFYVGPSFRDCQHPATWATDLLPNPEGKGRPITVLRDSFKGLFQYVEETDMFVCTDMPEIMRTEQVLNKMLAPFSHVQDTCRLIVKNYEGRSARICYRPDHEGMLVTYRGSAAINLHVPSAIRSVKGDHSPWSEFLGYMFVNERERYEAERWIATLIARPSIRMAYGMLLVSESQGIGKSTLGHNILAPLVGVWNVGFPGEQDITAPFNEWVAHKRLAIIGEIYSGSSWKAYHALKAVITDKEITVNQKYMRQYVIENWCHIFASSNSMRALKMENDDRRWFYPEICEKAWPKKKFEEFRAWIESGGLSIIKAWAEAFKDYVGPSERAPMTERKRELIEGSRSEAQREAVQLAEAVVAASDPIAISIKDVVMWCRNHVQGRVFDSDYELRRAMTEAGLMSLPGRMRIGQRMEYVLINPELRDKIQREGDDKSSEMVRAHLRKCNEIMESGM